MRRLLSPSVLVTTAILIAVVAVVASKNIGRAPGSKADGERLAGRRFARAPVSSAWAEDRGAGLRSRAAFDRRIGELEAALKVNPADAGTVVSLAEASIRRARLTGDAGVTKRAELAINRALEQVPDNYDLTRALGTIYLSQHRFREAVAVGEKNRAARPYDPVTYGMLGDAHLELGEYDLAFDAFDRMMALRPSAGAYARVSYARELQGNLTGATESMKLAEESTAADDPEGLAWTRVQLGELYLQLGRVENAKRAFTSASLAFPNHPMAVVGSAKTLVSEGRRDQALTLLQDLEQRSPTPDVHARIGDLLVALGRHDEAQKELALAEAGWRADMPEPKLFARFLADHDRNLEEAVAIARSASEVRDDIFTNDALAWTSFKAGRVDDAKAAIDRALRTGTRDRDILAHAAAIRGRVERTARR